MGRDFTVAEASKNWPLEKLIAWLVRALVALTVAYLALVAQGFQQDVDELRARAKALENQVEIVRTFAQALTTIQDHERRLSELERKEAAASAITGVNTVRLDRIEDKIDELLKRK